MSAAFRLLSRSLLTVVFVAAVCQAATLVRYPYLQNVGGDHATIMWATVESGMGAVRYSSDQKTFQTAPATVTGFFPAQTGLGSPYYQYRVDLTGLRPDTDYYYTVQVDGTTFTDLIPFHTAGPGPFNFLAFGDSGYNNPDQRNLATLMMGEKAVSLAVHTGDIAYLHGYFQEFQENHFNIYGSDLPWLYGNLMRSIPFFLTPGNHEYYYTYGAGTAFPYLALHSMPTQGVPAEDAGHYYSFDWGNAHFVSLDTNMTDAFEPGDEWKVRVPTPFTNAVNGKGSMLKWLDQDLANTSKFWRIAFFHESPYAGGNNAGDPVGKAIRDFVAPILERYNVPLAMNGHEHSYQRSLPIQNNAAAPDNSGGTVYITTGGGGMYLYPTTPPPVVGPVMAYGAKAFHYVRVEVQPYQLTIRAIGEDGKEFDRTTLAPKPRAAAVVNGASFGAAIAPGALVSIFGTFMAAEEARGTAFPLPTQFTGGNSGFGVSLNGRPIPLLYVSSTQINAQLPFDVKGSATLRVTTPNGTSDLPFTIGDVAPAIFMTHASQDPFPAVVHSSNYALVTSSSPAKVGEYISVFLTGLGQVDGTIAAGQAAPMSPLLNTTATVQVQFDSGPLLSPTFKGLAPGYAGLYQINVQVPQLSSGNHSMRVIAAGSTSNTVTLAIASTQ